MIKARCQHGDQCRGKAGEKIVQHQPLGAALPVSPADDRRLPDVEQAEHQKAADPSGPQMPERAVIMGRAEDGGQQDCFKPANLPVSAKVGQADAAASLNVSERSVRSAKTVLDKGTPELVHAMDQGILPVSVAAQAAALEPEKQREVVKAAEADKANVARTVVKKAARAGKEKALGEKQAALPNRKFGVIYADPEWRFEVYSRETGLDRAPRQPLSDQRGGRDQGQAGGRHRRRYAQAVTGREG